MAGDFWADLEQPKQGKGGFWSDLDQPPSMPVKFEGSQAALSTATGKPVLKNPDGTVSTEKTITIEADGKHFLIPTIIGGKETTREEAVRQWRAGTNQPVGVFGSAPEAERAARERSNRIGQSLDPYSRLAGGAEAKIHAPGDSGEH